MKRTAIVWCLLAPLLALGSCSGGIFDTRPPCADVKIDRSSAETKLDKDGVAQTSYMVTITYNKKFGPGFALMPDHATSSLPLQGSDVVALRLKANGYTLHGTKYGKDCNPTFRVA